MRSWRAGICALALTLGVPAGHASEIGDTDRTRAPQVAEEVPTGEERPTIPTVNELVGLGELTEGVDQVRISGNGYEEAAAAYLDTLSRLGQVNEDLDESIRARQGRDRRRGDQQAAAGTASRALQDATVERSDVEEAVRQLAVSSFVASGTSADAAVAPFETDSVNEALRRLELRAQAAEHQVELLGKYAGTVASLTDEVTELAARIDANAGAIAELDARIGRLRFEKFDLGVQLDRDAGAVRETRMLADVVGADFPVVALDAYAAAATLARETTDCRIRWWMIAAVGKTESGHGVAQGSELLADGSTSERILGLPLDGENGTRHIPDTDGGALDGHPTVDRAVGPMQFIPQSWQTLGVDGDDDGEIDPHNLYDAAASAALYLCRGRAMTTDEDLRAAYFSYNQNPEYVDLVVARAHAYRDLGLGL